MENRVIRVGIGFATGRKHFQRVLRSYIYNWMESGLVDNKNISLNLFVAYDLKYMGTKSTDFTAIPADISDLIDSQHFIGAEQVEQARQFLVDADITDRRGAELVFQKGYASLRNAIVYEAIKNRMDYLLFLDDDEYPMAVTKNRDTALWSGQHVLATHLKSIEEADLTYGYHCGYISPIPSIDFSAKLREDDFRQFISAISNDIVNWDSIKKVVQNGGVTYADAAVLAEHRVEEVPEIKGAKFISGANLCIKLTRPERVYPFYNPPGARGEDTFLSTCLSERRVLRVPCYAFHDGFGAYNHLLSGALPTKLKPISADSEPLVRRFYNACVGWTRYKPLLLYITERADYDDRIADMTDKLDRTLPSICAYFGTELFYNIQKELRKYDRNVKKHFDEYAETREIWAAMLPKLGG